MLTLRWAAFPTLALASSILACSSDDTSGTPDASSADVVAEGSPCGPINLICRQGTQGKACSQVPTNVKCNGTAWECTAGSISASQCGCIEDNTRPVGGDCGKDASVPDANDSDGATGDASDGGTGG